MANLCNCKAWERGERFVGSHTRLETERLDFSFSLCPETPHFRAPLGFLAVLGIVPLTPSLTSRKQVIM